MPLRKTFRKKKANEPIPGGPEDALSGQVERVTFHNEENGFCVLKVKVQGRKDPVAVLGSLHSVAAVRSGERRMEEFLGNEIPKAKISRSAEGWSVSLSLPLTASPGDRIRVSCCRYDYGSSRAPIISSTSPHPVRDFHRPQDWREIVLMED